MAGIFRKELRMAFQDWAPREHLAAFAMVGILASDHANRFNAELVANMAYEVADAMMIRNQQEPDTEPTEE